MNRQLVLDVLPAPGATLENYIAGDNAEALSTLQNLQTGRAVYLWGADGCGRTHLLTALCQQEAGLLLTLDASAEKIRTIADTDATIQLPRLLAVDDLHRMDTDQQAAVFALYNRWRASAASPQGFALAVAGNQAPMAMPLREDLRTRLGWDLVFRLTSLSDADKRHALETQAAARGLQLSPEVLNWILTHYERDIRRLSALLDALDRYSLATRRAITVPLLRAMLADPNTTVA